MLGRLMRLVCRNRQLLFALLVLHLGCSEQSSAGILVNGKNKLLIPSVGAETSVGLLSPPGVQKYPDVSWDGNNFLVVWEEKRTVYPATARRIYGVRISKDGVVLDSSPFPISPAPGTTPPYQYDQFLPAVAFDGKNHLVVWSSGYTKPTGT